MKKIYLILLIPIDICALGIIPLNLFIFDMPEFISIIFSILILLLNVLFIIKGNSKRLSKCLVSFLSVVIVCCTLFCSYCNPYWNSISFKVNKDYYSHNYDYILSMDEAREDLDYAMKYLKKVHPGFLYGVPEDIQQRYEEVAKELGEYKQIDVCTISQLIESIFSLLGDGHTYLKAYYSDSHYLKYIYQRNHEGYRLVEINGIELNELLRQHSQLYSYEVESWGMLSLENDLTTLEGLNYLGLSAKNGINYTYEDEKGNRDTAVYQESDFITYDEYVVFNNLKNDNQTNDKPFVYYKIDEEHSHAIMTLTSCKFNDEYRNCVKEMFTKVKAFGIKNVSVDLRDNGGGNSLVADEFIRYLDIDSYKESTYLWRMGCFKIPFSDGKVENKKYDDLLFGGNVYLLTSTSTFSSAMEFAQYIKDNDLGTIIGEAPGNTPNGYGEITEFKLPNSKILMQISTKEFFRADKQCKDELIMPDIDCDSNDALNVLYDNLK